MKLFICLSFTLLLASYSGAETYSWIDDSGTYNFTEDPSSIPPRYRNKVNRREDLGKDPVSQEPAAQASKAATAEAPEAKPAAAPGTKPAAAPVEDKKLYDGKTPDAWRQEMESQEAELAQLEQRMDQLYKEFFKEPKLYADQLRALKKEYDDTKGLYVQKYKVYSGLIESARKAGLTVNMKK